MPKQLVDVEKNLLNTGRKMIFEEGYSVFSMRKLANNCNLAVGTVYNYVKSKEELLAKITLSDWGKISSSVKKEIGDAPDFESAMLCIYDRVKEFRMRYIPFFTSYAVTNSAKDQVTVYHPLFKKEIESLVEPVLIKFSRKPGVMNVLPVFAELMISCVTKDSIDRDDFIAFLHILDI